MTRARIAKAWWRLFDWVENAWGRHVAYRSLYRGFDQMRARSRALADCERERGEAS